MRIAFLLILLTPFSAVSQLRVPAIFSDNMVLQRERPVHFWGRGVPGRKVEVLFDEEKKQAAVKSDSSWSIFFNPRKANAAPASILITSGGEEILLKNVLIGDLWLCLGQSNMEWPMKNELHFRETLSRSNDPLLRLYNPVYAGKNIYGVPFTDSVRDRLNPERFYSGQWAPSDSSSVRNMSAVAWYFGREITTRMHIPIGLIHLAIGGAPIETFISRETLRESAHFSAKVESNWLYNEKLPVWVRERGMQNVGPGVSNEKQDARISNENPDSSTGEEAAQKGGPNHAFKPGFAYASGIAPLHPLPVRGIIWYQGESNAQEIERVREYNDLFSLMVDDYREKWNEASLPVYWVQLSSIDTANYRSQLWPLFRDRQRLLLKKMKHGGMAVSSDIGSRNDVHPREKRLVGKRLALWALKDVYGEEILSSGPLPMKARYRKGKVIIDFRYTGPGLKTAGCGALKGFSIDGKKEVKAIAMGNRVLLPAGKKPDFIYYNWQPFATGNLVNSAGLPASTFKIRVR